ncbi:hypothetical protein BLNAU_8770 [Blattamonas nauphoetae]|uniref:Uncharacterized protein n=1 Tax=Blattamonas nauphoetae TaxID=2049346 RepID=A0ABQ9XXJ6_9EUKA|nr:hypothetical protein BLNAU_8770 [Blattamonas nauphoetae]
MRTSSERPARHHAIKFLLAQTLKEILSITVRTETKMGRDEEDANKEETNATADLQLRITTGYTKHRFVRDILGMMDPKGRVKEAERKKERKYNRVGQGHTVIGIGSSDHGHSSPNTSLFFDFITQLAAEMKISNPLPTFCTQVSVIMELVRSHVEQTLKKMLNHLARRKEEERKRSIGIELDMESFNLITSVTGDSLHNTHQSINHPHLPSPLLNSPHPSQQRPTQG